MTTSYRAVVYFLKQYKSLYCSVILVSILVAFLEALNLALFYPILNELFGASAASQTGAGRILVSLDQLVSLLPFSSKVISTIILLISCTLIKSSISILNEAQISHMSATMLYDIKRALMQKYARTKYQYFLDHKQGELNYNLLIAPHKATFLILKSALLITEVFKTLAIVIILFGISRSVTLVFIPLAFIFNLIISLLAKKVSYVIGIKRINATTEQASIFHEFISGIKQIKVYVAANKWLNQFDAHNKDFSKLYVKDNVWLSIPKHMLEVMAVLLLFGMILFVQLYRPGSVSGFVPLLGVFAMAVLKIFPSSANIARMRMEIVGAFPEMEVTYKVLTTPIEEPPSGPREFKSFAKNIKFEDVYFAYKEDHPILDSIDLLFEKNKITALVGLSGSGKTTVVNLLLGLFKPGKGKILVDDTNELSEFSIDSWLSKIGIVTQDAFIFHSSIEDNIRFGLQQPNLQEIEEAARLANANEFITGLPQGYQTVVGERGMKLSGGQQQRIAIARAILRDPQVLIFDEAMSNLDTVSEKLIQESLRAIIRERTVIMISHRMQTIIGADSIIVLKDGRVDAQGTHDGLMRTNTFYRSLYDMDKIT